jgi:hypothetical protein
MMKPLGIALLMLTATSVVAEKTQGVVEIDQGAALRGGVTAGDAPGFPVTLSVPGSYRLSGNLAVPAGSTGVQINADSVSLDLDGFSIVGPNTCNGDSRTQTTTCTDIFTFDGVFSEKAQITIRNGTIRGMRFGIFLTRGPALIEEIHATGNTATGIKIETGVVRRSTASNNGSDGISAFGSDGDSTKGASVISDNVAVGNRNNGIVGSGARVTGNASYLNRTGIWTWDSIVLENTMRSSEATGLIVFRSLYGSNTLANNASDLAVFPGSVSQNNNNCNGAVC